jgi:hypothetical protein
MKQLLGFVNTVLPALLMAASVTLLASGLLSYGAPAGAIPLPPFTPIPVSPSPAAVALQPPSSPATVAPSPGISGDSEPTPSAAASVSPSQAPVAVATRIVIPAQGIDLPIVSRDLSVPDQGPDRYPPCDVAIYHTAFQQPGQPGSTYIYGHAREGMFLPLLDASARGNGASLIGDLVQVYTDDNREYVYAITVVKRDATDFALAENAPPGVSQLVVQTSEGPAGTAPKLQILAAPIGVLSATRADSHPKAKPRGCYQTP